MSEAQAEAAAALELFHSIAAALVDTAPPSRLRLIGPPLLAAGHFAVVFAVNPACAMCDVPPLRGCGRRSAAQKLDGYECTHGLLVNDTWLRYADSPTIEFVFEEGSELRGSACL